MRTFNQLPKSLVLFWLIQIAVISALWGVLPSRSIGSLLIALVATNGVLIYLKQFELPIFSTVALVLVLAHFWLGNNIVSPLLASLVIFGLISTVGLISASSSGPINDTPRGRADGVSSASYSYFMKTEGSQTFLQGSRGRTTGYSLNKDDLLAWSVIGLLTAQIATLVQFWPISNFQKSMLGTIVFYLIWQSWLMINPSPTESTDHQSRRSLWWHFIFVGMAVMVVVVNIIWTTWPGLKTF